MFLKILLFLFILSCINTLREIFLFWLAYRSEKPNMTQRRLVLVGISVAYILTILITGFGI